MGRRDSEPPCTLQKYKHPPDPHATRGGWARTCTFNGNMLVREAERPAYDGTLKERATERGCSIFHNAIALNPQCLVWLIY